MSSAFMPNANILFNLIVGFAILVMALLMFLAFTSLLRIWLQGILAGVRITIIDLLAMRLRRIDTHAVMKSLILATQSGVPISHVELQRAYLRGVDLEKITLAYLQAQKRSQGVTFEELVELDLQDRLAAKLKE